MFYEYIDQIGAGDSMEFNETDIDGTSGEHHMTQSDRGDKSSEDLHNIQADRHDDGVFSSSPVDPAADDAGLCGVFNQSK